MTNHRAPTDKLAQAFADLVTAGSRPLTHEQQELIAFALQERDDLLAALRWALPQVDMTNAYAPQLGKYHGAQDLLARYDEPGDALDNAPSVPPR
jgi:hypothetical protein